MATRLHWITGLHLLTEVSRAQVARTLRAYRRVHPGKKITRLDGAYLSGGTWRQYAIDGRAILHGQS